MWLTRLRVRPVVGLAVSLVALVLVLAPLLGQAVAANVLGVVLLRTTQPFGTSWLRPDARTPMLWSAQRHAATLDLGSPGSGQPASLAVKIGEWSATYLPPDRASPFLTMLRLLTGNWPAAASALQVTERNGPLTQQELETAYGYQALEGLAALDAQDFARASAHLQRAAWLGGDRSARDGVYRALYLALSGWYDQIADAQGGSWHVRYLSARYLDRAVDPRALNRLEQLRGGSPADASPQDQADVRIRLARRALDQGDNAAATSLMREGMTFTPVAGATTTAEEILILQQLGLADEVRRVTTDLIARGPAYRVGTWRNQAWTSEPNSVGPAWMLDGYDLDVQDLQDGAEINALLYWHDAAGFAIEPRVLTNMAPNGGFEWLPAHPDAPNRALRDADGYQGGVYGEQASIDRIVEVERGGARSHALILDNQPPATRSGVLSVAAIPVQSDGLYLQAAWRRDQGRGLIGRSCGTDSGAGGPYYVADSDRSGEWRYYATLARPLAGLFPADLCQVFLANLDSVGQTFFDDLLLTHISVPGDEIIRGK